MRRNFGENFVLQFPGRLAARNFTQIPPHIRKSNFTRVPNPPGANPFKLVAERAFPASDYWGRTGVARCAEEMTGICRDSPPGC